MIPYFPNASFLPPQGLISVCKSHTLFQTTPIMNSFEMPVTVATKASFLSCFHVDPALSKIGRIEAGVERTGAGRSRIPILSV